MWCYVFKTNSVNLCCDSSFWMNNLYKDVIAIYSGWDGPIAWKKKKKWGIFQRGKCELA